MTEKKTRTRASIAQGINNGKRKKKQQNCNSKLAELSNKPLVICRNARNSVVSINIAMKSAHEEQIISGFSNCQG